jgi:hypothetical protein
MGGESGTYKEKGICVLFWWENLKKRATWKTNVRVGGWY